MKKLLTTCVFLLYHNLLPAQIVIENVNFDNYVSPADNDLENYFDIATGLSQLTSGGIYGGCVLPPLTVNWGNDNAIYCSKYSADSMSALHTSISFRYDITQFNPVNFDRAVSLFLRPSSDFNHYVIASVNIDRKIQVLSYSFANSSQPLNLISGNWYRLYFDVGLSSPAPYYLDVSASVYDLGPTGLSTPVQVDLLYGTFADTVFFGDTAVQVSFTAAQWAGASRIDEFHFEGVKSPDSCGFSPVSVAELKANDFSVYPNPFKNEIRLTSAIKQESEFLIYDAFGRLISTHSIHGDAVIATGDLAPGSYIYMIRDESRQIKNGIIIKD